MRKHGKPVHQLFCNRLLTPPGLLAQYYKCSLYMKNNNNSVLKGLFTGLFEKPSKKPG
jgi:hypothetical protein